MSDSTDRDGAHMRIGELSRRTGASERALRYYEQQGLLTAARTPGGHREYAESDVGKVALVQRLIGAGVSSAKMAEIFPCVFGGHSKPTVEVVADLCQERERINGMIDDLVASRSILDDMITEARVAAGV